MKRREYRQPLFCVICGERVGWAESPCGEVRAICDACAEEPETCCGCDAEYAEEDGRETTEHTLECQMT